MTLPREEVVAGFTDELVRFGDLVRSIDAKEWTSASRCEGWTAADVAAHVTGQLSDIVNGRFDGLGTPEVTDREVIERRGKTPDEIADELAEAAKVGADILASFDDAAWAGPRQAASRERWVPVSRVCGSTRGCTPTTSATRLVGRRRPGPACASVVAPRRPLDRQGLGSRRRSRCRVSRSSRYPVAVASESKAKRSPSCSSRERPHPLH